MSDKELSAEQVEELLAENDGLHAKVTRLHRLLGASMDLADATHEEVRVTRKSVADAMKQIEELSARISKFAPGAANAD